jgi:exosortase
MSVSSAPPTIDYAGPQILRPQPTYYGLTASAWVRIGALGILLAGLFWPNLRRLWLKTNPFTGEPNWGHAFLVPIIGLYYLYLNRESLLKLPVRTAWSGLPILLAGLLMFAYGIWPGQNDFVKDFAMVITLFGVVSFLCGWHVMRVAWFPVLFLVAAFPWPPLVYSWIALPLQQLAASAAVGTLRATGVDAVQTGTKIIMGEGDPPRILNVAEACAGLKSLMTFITVGAMIGFLSMRPLWQKIFITLTAIPIAIFCNMMRVAGQGLLDHYVSRHLSESFAHQFVGLVMLVPAFFLLMLVGWVLDNLFVEEIAQRDIAQRPRSASAPRAAETAPPQGVSGDLAAATRRLMSTSLRQRPSSAPSSPTRQEAP